MDFYVLVLQVLIMFLLHHQKPLILFAFALY